MPKRSVDQQRDDCEGEADTSCDTCLHPPSNHERQCEAICKLNQRCLRAATRQYAGKFYCKWHKTYSRTISLKEQSIQQLKLHFKNMSLVSRVDTILKLPPALRDHFVSSYDVWSEQLASKDVLKLMVIPLKYNGHPTADEYASKWDGQGGGIAQFDNNTVSLSLLADTITDEQIFTANVLPFPYLNGANVANFMFIVFDTVSFTILSTKIISLIDIMSQTYDSIDSGFTNDSDIDIDITKVGDDDEGYYNMFNVKFSMTLNNIISTLQTGRKEKPLIKLITDTNYMYLPLKY